MLGKRRWVNTTDNSGAGGLYGNFTQACELTSGGLTATRAAPTGTAFLLLPMAFDHAPPTVRMC